MEIWKMRSWDFDKHIDLFMGDESSVGQLDLLKNKISLSNSELYELAYNHQKFMSTVRKFNNEAKNKIDFEMPQEALIYLAEAERVLEYAASCGKNIDRNLIICVLHNEACCHQKSWDLEKCSNYLEALIYNFQCNSDSIQTSPQSHESKYKDDSLFSEEEQVTELMKKPLSHRFHLCKYELQFCAINSQLRNHKSALVSGRRSIKLIKSIFKQLQKIGQEYYLPLDHHKSVSYHPLEEEDFQSKMRVIQGICTMDDAPDISKLEEYYITTKYYLSKWNIRKLEMKNQTLKETLRNFSIGSVMQLRPLTFEENRESTIDIEKWLQNEYQQKTQTQIFSSQTYEKILNKVLLLSMGYFTIATQIRLLCNEKYRKSEQLKKQSKEYKESQIYHLISLIIPCIYVPYDMLYIRHILASFNNHYPNTIDSSFSMINEERVLKKMFDTLQLADEKEKKKKINNTTLMSNDFEKSIRISSSNLVDDFGAKKSSRKNSSSKDKKFKKSVNMRRKEEARSRNNSKKNSSSKLKETSKNKQKIKKMKSQTSEIPKTTSKNKDMKKEKSSAKSKLSTKVKEQTSALSSEGNEYFQFKKKGVKGKGKSRQKKRQKSKDNNPSQLKKNIDKYYF